MNDRAVKSRFALSAALILLAILGLGVRLAFLHLGPHASVRERIEGNRSIEKRLAARRGLICDRRGNTLALDVAVKDVCADPLRVQESNAVGRVALRLAEALDMPANAIAIRLTRPNRRFEYVKRFVSEEQADAIEKQGLIGVFFRDATCRHYPQGDFMCHVLGFVNHQGVGSAGVEQRFDPYLRGCPGVLESRVNALRQELYWERGRHVPALEGANVTLNLDQHLQYMVEKTLRDLLEEHRAAAAWAIVQRVRSGEILAMASQPTFDPNRFNSAGELSRLNRAIGAVYEPGSTFKPAVIAAAINEGVVTPETVIDCENGKWFYRGRPLRDFHPYGKLTVADVLKKSSNIGTAKIALKLGKTRLYNYLRAFGIGARLGIDLPGEEAGILHPPSTWSAICPTRIAIGQGVSVTALQMLGVLSTIGNDGFVMRPTVTRRVRGDSGSVLLEPQREVLARPISKRTAATMRRLLQRVTEKGGTGRRACVEGYRVAGKTGTAQKPVAGGYSSTDYMASFAGFLPADDPEIAVIVVVDAPQPFHTGGRVAGPAFSRIAGQAVRYLDVPPVGRHLANSTR
jgi:cell division protein FtsI (penicillin-binding protein 3)